MSSVPVSPIIRSTTLQRAGAALWPSSVSFVSAAPNILAAPQRCNHTPERNMRYAPLCSASRVMPFAQYEAGVLRASARWLRGACRRRKPRRAATGRQAGAATCPESWPLARSERTGAESFMASSLAILLVRLQSASNDLHTQVAWRR